MTTSVNIITRCARMLGSTTIFPMFDPVIPDIYSDQVSYQPPSFTIGSPQDPGNNIFTSEQAALDFYYATAAANIISTLNSVDSPNTYALGVRIDLPYNMYADFADIPEIITGSHIADCATDAATNAVTSLATNYGVLTSLLTLAGALNTANAAQNDLASKYNYLAAKYDDLATKFNAVLAALETNKILAS